MKETILLFAWLFYMVGMSASAQTSELEYRPFSENGKVWETKIGGIKENVYYNYIDGDTLINGKNWKKVYNYIAFPDGESYYAAIRDVGKKVYAIAKGNTKPRLLYDFGMKVGDMVKCGVEGNAFACLLDVDEKPDSLFGFYYVSYLRVERIDTIIVKGLQHRRFVLTFLDHYKEPLRNENEFEHDNVIWVEGVGSGAGPFAPWLLLPPRNRTIQYCYVNKDCIFSSSGFYDNSEPAAIGTALYNKDEEGFIYNLQGRHLGNQPSKGIYIQNGKKVVIK